MPVYLRPASTEHALAALRDAPLVVLGGGTDFYPSRVDKPLIDDVLDLSSIAELAGIEAQSTRWRIGAMTSWAAIRDAAFPSWLDCLRSAAREIGGEQIQNAGTLGGNLCNASPAADGIPPLLALDARVELASTRGRRELPLTQFILGPRRTARAPDELLTTVWIPIPPGLRGSPTNSTAGTVPAANPVPGVGEAHVAETRPARAASAFVKLGSRRYLVISFAMAAALVVADPCGRVVSARVAVGACSPVATRLAALEQALLGRVADAALAEVAQPDHLDVLAPISDVRADAGYRIDVALTLVRRALADVGAELAAGEA